MNYKNSAVSEIENLIELFPAYTLGQILLSVIKRKPEGISISEWLYTISDEDLFTEIEKTKQIEEL